MFQGGLNGVENEKEVHFSEIGGKVVRGGQAIEKNTWITMGRDSHQKNGSLKSLI